MNSYKPRPRQMPAAGRQMRRPAAPDNTSPSAVAATLERVVEEKRARLGPRPAEPRLAEKPPSAPLRPTRPIPAVDIFGAEYLPAAPSPAAPNKSRAVSRKPRPQEKAVVALYSLASHAPAVKEAVLGFLDTLRPEPLPPAGSEGKEETLSRNFERSLSGELRRGGRVLGVAAVFVLGWAGLVPLSGAVIVAGTLVVQSSVKKVQHPTGGVVSEIFVHNGSKVKAGDELLRLDETSAHTNLQVVARQLDETRLRISRLNAERDGAKTPHWPTEMSAELTGTERETLLASERDLFSSRASARQGQKDLAQSRIEQLQKQISGLEAQQASNTKQMQITAGELKNVQKLLQQKLVTMDRLTTLQRESARLDGIDGQLSSQIAETRNKVNEARLQGLQADEGFRSDVMRDLNDAEAKEGELIERKAAALDQAKRTIVRAPSSGAVQELAVHTVGGVVSPGEVMMAVVPDGDALEIDARLSPDKIDQVHVGQEAHVRLSAFDTRTTPELAGAVETVSADVVRDPQSAAGYYDIRVSLPASEVSRLGKVHLVPGMPAEVFLQTGSRTMLSYLFKPMSDQLSRMFRER